MAHAPFPGVGHWSPILGCAKVSPACDYCAGRAWDPSVVKAHSLVHRSTVLDESDEWNGQVVYDPDMLVQPFAAPNPGIANVGITSDVFYSGVQDAWVTAMFGVMARLPRHRFIVPTRYASRAKDYLNAPGTPDAVQASAADWNGTEGAEPIVTDWPLPHVTLAVSVEDQTRADARVPDLVAASAARRMVQCSPLMGAIDLSTWAANIDWVSIAPLYDNGSVGIADPSWVTSIADWCDSEDIPLFFHGWGHGFLSTPSAELKAAALEPGRVRIPAQAVHQIRGRSRREWPGF